MKVALGCAKVAYNFKEAIKKHLLSKGIEVIDFCDNSDDPMIYSHKAAEVCEYFQEGKADRAILFCGTGMGMSIIANKFKGIYAAVVESSFAAHRCRSFNNANILCLGSYILTENIACEIVDEFIETNWLDGSTQEIVDLLKTHDVFIKEKIEDINFK